MPAKSAAPSMHLSRARFLKWMKILAVIGSCQAETVLRVTLYEKNIGREEKQSGALADLFTCVWHKVSESETGFFRWLGG